MNIIANGPSGVNVDEALESLKKEFLEQEKYSEKGSEKFFKVYSLENEIAKTAGITFFSYLDKDDYDYQEKIFASSFETLLKQMKEDNSENKILSMNYPYFRDDRFFPAFGFDLIKKFQLDVIITFIDDAITCWGRIIKREESLPTRSYFRIRDMFTWRSASTLFGDIIAKNFNKRNYLVSVKHPPSMLYRLIFKYDKFKKIYSSYPITSMREKPETRKIVDDFRFRMHEEFCVFDPVTIDDRLLITEIEKAKGNPEIIIKKDSRWPLPEDFPMVSENDIWEKITELKVPTEQVQEVTKPISENERSIIDKHILYRDYRLIRDSDALVAGRPFFNGHPSRGVTSEIQYATQIAAKPCYLFWNESEDGPPGDSPFAGKGILSQDLEKIIVDVKKLS